MANVEQVIVKDSGGVEADVTASNALKVDGSAVTQPVSGTVTINAIPAGTNNIGDVDVLSLPTLPAGTNNIGDVDVLTLPALPAGTNAIGKLAANDGVDIGDVTINNTSLPIAGDVAHDAADSGSPVKVGAKAANALPTAVANGDRTNNISDLFGRQLFSHIDPAMQVAITKTAFNATTTQTGGAMWTPASGKKIALTSLTIGTYGTTAARVIIWFGASGDTTYNSGTDQAVVIASFAPSATVKPGLVFTPAVPVFCNNADYILRITTDAGISIDVTFNGYEY